MSRKTIAMMSASLAVLCLLASTGLAEAGVFRERRMERRAARMTKEIDALQDPSTVLPTSGNYRRHLEFDGRDRFYDLHIPRSYDSSKATPVVLNFHGRAGNPVQQRNDSRMDPVADRNGFIVVYPAGTAQRTKERFLTWNIGRGDSYATTENVDDIGFTKAIIDDVSKLCNVDQRRIYATGFSMGGTFTYKLACLMSDRIAAFAPVAGLMLEPREHCLANRPVPIIHFHGTADEFAAYNGGVASRSAKSDPKPRPAVKKVIMDWVKADGLPEKPCNEGSRGEAKFVCYGSNKDNPEVILWTVEGMGHTWPGGESTVPALIVGPLSKAISASKLMWEFFERHPMPQTP